MAAGCDLLSTACCDGCCKDPRLLFWSFLEWSGRASLAQNEMIDRGSNPYRERHNFWLWQKKFIRFVRAKKLRICGRILFKSGEQDNERPYLKYRKIFSSPFQLDCPRLRHSRWMQKWLLSLPAVFSRWGVSTVVPKHALKKSNWINRNAFW